MSEKIAALIEEVKGLSVLELSELVHALEETFGVASFAVWAVVTVGTLLQVYGVKLNLVTILLCVAFCIAGYYVVSGLRDWFLHACYSYDINDVLSGLGDLFG